jgi:O-antigen/teichoic acid export membrane protein
MLRVQSLLFLTTPFIALPSALLARRLDFKQQAWINLGSALSGAVTALSCAWMGFGVWTLVIAPIVMFTVRAIGLTLAARLLVWPSFDFRGSGDVVRFGTALLLSQLFWILQSQADIFIAGRVLNPHNLGLYSEALFLTLIFTGRFIPPLNEVAFPAYAHLAKTGQNVAPAFVTTARLIMLVAAPLYIGLSLTATPLVKTLFGPKWLEMIPVVSGLALAMPFMALQIMCSPATNALSRPRIYVHSSMAGAAIMPLAYLIGIHWGVSGLVHAWQIGAPLLLLATLRLTLPAIGATWSDLAKAMVPVATAAGAMAVVVALAAPLTGGLTPVAALCILVATGAGVYALILRLFWPELVDQLIQLVLRRNASVPAPADQTTTSAAQSAA